MKNTMNLLKEDVFKLFIKFLIPGVSGTMMVAFYILVDTIFIGRGVGTQGLAALNIAIPIYTVLYGIGLLLGIGGATALSISLGENKPELANKIFNHSFFIAVALSIGITLFGLLFLEKISYFLGASSENIVLVKDYLVAILSFSFAFILVNTLTPFIRNDKAPKIAMISTVTGGLTNIVLDAIFIFVFGWGMFGAAIATAISSVLSLAILCIYVLRNSSILKIRKVNFDMSIIRRITLNGFSTFIIELSSGIVIFAFNKAIYELVGNIGISAYSIIANISLICISIFNGVAQSIQPIISINYGAENYDRVSKVKSFGIITALIFGVVFFALGSLFPEAIVALFAKDSSSLMELTVKGIRIYFTSFILMGINIVLGSYIQSIEKPLHSTAISLNRGVVLILVGLTILPSFLGIDGVWLTVPVAEAINLLVVVMLLAKFIKLDESIQVAA